MRTLRLAVIAAVVFTMAAVSGRAYAFFTTPAGGSGRAAVIATIDVNVTTQDLTGPTQKLYPGASKVLDATVTNPNPFPVALDDVTVAAVISGAEEACPGTHLTAAPGVLATAPIASGQSATIPITVALSPSAPSGCQGVLFTIPLSVKVKVLA